MARHRRRRAVKAIDGADPLPPRSALITFDDAFRSLADAALRALDRAAYPAVVFVPTAFVGRTNTFDEQAEPEELICSWSELRSLAGAGFSVQSHGVSHRGFSKLSTAEREHELVASKEELEERLGTSVELFAFPYGDTGGNGETARLLGRSGYKAAFAYGGGPVALPAKDRFRLERLAMGPETDLRARFVHSAGARPRGRDSCPLGRKPSRSQIARASRRSRAVQAASLNLLAAGGGAAAAKSSSL